MGISGLQVKSEEFLLIHGSAFRRSFVFDCKVNTSLHRFQIFPATFPLLFEIREETRGLRGKVWGKKRKNKRISLHNPKINLTFVAKLIFLKQTDNE